MNEWEQKRREKREQRIREIVAEYKCTQKTAYRILSLEATCADLDERLGKANIKLFELQYGPVSDYPKWWAVESQQ